MYKSNNIYWIIISYTNLPTRMLLRISRTQSVEFVFKASSNWRAPSLDRPHFCKSTAVKQVTNAQPIKDTKSAAKPKLCVLFLSVPHTYKPLIQRSTSNTRARAAAPRSPIRVLQFRVTRRRPAIPFNWGCWYLSDSAHAVPCLCNPWCLDMNTYFTNIKYTYIWKDRHHNTNIKLTYYHTLMMLARCSAPLQVRLQPVKSSVRILVEYFTLWQMTEILKYRYINIKTHIVQ